MSKFAAKSRCRTLDYEATRKTCSHTFTCQVRRPNAMEKGLWHCTYRQIICTANPQKTESEHGGHLTPKGHGRYVYVKSLAQHKETTQACFKTSVSQHHFDEENKWSWNICHAQATLTSTPNMIFRYTTAPLNALINALCTLYLAVESLGNQPNNTAKNQRWKRRRGLSASVATNRNELTGWLHIQPNPKGPRVIRSCSPPYQVPEEYLHLEVPGSFKSPCRNWIMPSGIAVQQTWQINGHGHSWRRLTHMSKFR
jgi:hypothetical protein